MCGMPFFENVKSIALFFIIYSFTTNHAFSAKDGAFLPFVCSKLN